MEGRGRREEDGGRKRLDDKNKSGLVLGKLGWEVTIRRSA